MPVKCLCKAVDIRAYISEQMAKAKVMNKKAIDQKKMFLKTWKALKRAHEEVDHYHSKCVGHIFEETVLKEELKKLLEQISQVTWDVAIQMALLQS